MAITAETRNDIIELVVTAYNAAPGTTLLTELVAIVDGGGSLADVATALTTSDRWAELYPSFQTAEEFATEWLGNLVPEASEEALAEGVSVAVGLINGGASFADLVIEAQGFLSATAEDDASFGTSAANFNNKVEVATNHTVTLELDGSEDELANVLVDVTSDDDTVTEANDEQSQSGSSGSTIALTTKTDDVTGTTSDDIINGIIDKSGTETTWNVTDSIDGGAGDDTINATYINSGTTAGSSSAGLAATAEILNIQHIDTDGGTANTSTIDLAGITGETQVWVRDGSVIGSTNDDAVTLTSITDGATIGIANNDSDLNISATTTGTGTSGDSISVAAGGGSHGTITLNDAAGDGFATVNVASTGSKNTIANLNGGTDFKSLVVTGDQALTVSAGLTGITTLDASAATGAVTATVTAGTSLKATGGSGIDTLITVVSSSVVSGMEISGFDIVAFAPSASATVDLDLISGALGYSSVGGSPANTLTLKDAPADASFTFSGTGSSTTSAFHTGLTLNLADTSSSSDSASIAVSNLGATDGKIDSTIGTVTVAGVETLNISGADYDNGTFTAVNATSAKTVNITGSVDFTFTGANFGALEILDASDSTGDLTIADVQATAQDNTITTGSGKDNVVNSVVAAGKTQTINTGDGNDTVRIVDTGNATGAVTVDLGAGDDTINLNTANVTVGTQKVDAGADEDLLTVNGAFTFTLAELDNVEAINFVSGNSVLNFGAPTGYADTVLVTDVGGNVTINITPALGGSVSVANYDMLGWTDGTDVLSITSNTGNETITLGSEAGTETVIFGAGAFGDTISGFTAGATEDNLDLTITAVETAVTGTNDLVLAGNAATSITAAASVFATVAAAFDLGTAATASILAVTGTYAATTDLEDALEVGGARALTANGAFAANDMFLAAYSDGTNSYIAIVKTTAGAANDATFAAADLTVTNIVTLSGITDVTTLHADNADFI